MIGKQSAAPKVLSNDDDMRVSITAPKNDAMAFEREVDAPPCPSCGSIMVRSGACHRCLNCGSTSGCS